MAKKYLTIEEAAELLGVEPSDLSRLREKGEIRAFADRGNWKFRQDDVDELARKRQTDSDPDVPIFRSPPSSKPTKDEFSDSFSLDIPGSGKDDSSINLGNEPDEVIGNQPTIVRKGGLDDLMGSDSD
ncbi:MAG: helix-turn-helix domain-containing protein, partial [Planctomycetota bacterium]